VSGEIEDSGGATAAGVTSPPAAPDASAGEHRAPASAAEVGEMLGAEGYIADQGLASALYVAGRLSRPLFLEGEPGVGKTEAAKAYASASGARLIRLQCYEGIDVHQALYDWNYARQMLYIRALEKESAGATDSVREVFGPEFLIRRPLLEALQSPVPVVLLIDEIDRADDEFEAFLLELLSDYQVTIPEIGTIVAERRPLAILTSNRTREVHDALKRRCLYHWIEYPGTDREIEILRARVPEVSDELGRQLCAVVHRLRALELRKSPGIGETLDWASALRVLGFDRLDDEAIEASIGAVLKVREDQTLALGELIGSDAPQ
jgi:MoxR-like ATPase